MITVKFTEVPDETTAVIVHEGEVIRETLGVDASFEIPDGVYVIRVRHPRSSFELYHKLGMAGDADLEVDCARVRARW